MKSGAARTTKLQDGRTELLRELSRELRSSLETERQKSVQELLDEEAVDDDSVWHFTYYWGKGALKEAGRVRKRMPILSFISGRGFESAGVRKGDFIDRKS